MKVLVDTCIWSQALRHKKPDQSTVKKLSDLVRDGRAVLIGPIRQELLSGIADTKQFEKLADILRAFEEIPVTSDVYEVAAQFSNQCRSKGIRGSTIDFQICAVAYAEGLQIYTVDEDFKCFARHLPITLMN